MSIVIKVENLYKQYRLGEVGTGSMKDDLKRWRYKVMGREDPFLTVGEENDRTLKARSKYVWALKDINFEVKQGEVLGIIGRNGAGKSTLLKILSRTTGPTKGTLKMKGRVASLLEVGTGFHGELSGRENIYLNGSIMGMRRIEITRKLDEIVDFAGVEKYIDTPVKRYSSGMYVRLAFGVAAHLEPDIMIVDEVLAVGDAEFQRKAINKMREISTKNGRTVLFVSHNMKSIASLTNQCLLLSNGAIDSSGETEEILQRYYRYNFDKENIDNDYTLSTNEPRITEVLLKTSERSNIHKYNEQLLIRFTIQNPVSVKDAAISYQIFNSDHEPVLHVLNLNKEQSFCTQKGTYILESVIPKLRLYPDDYYLVVHFADGFTNKKFQTIEGICSFEVKVFNQEREYYWNRKQAVYVEDTHWNINYINTPSRNYDR
jgi:lipopolysaccharide transport system ATP-binding protein